MKAPNMYDEPVQFFFGEIYRNEERGEQAYEIKVKSDIYPRYASSFKKAVEIGRSVYIKHESTRLHVDAAILWNTIENPYSFSLHVFAGEDGVSATTICGTPNGGLAYGTGEAVEFVGFNTVVEFWSSQDCPNVLCKKCAKILNFAKQDLTK